jgi:hypothetical protein
MKVTDQTKDYLESKEISLLIENMENACKTYNKLKDYKNNSSITSNMLILEIML